MKKRIRSELAWVLTVIIAISLLAGCKDENPTESLDNGDTTETTVATEPEVLIEDNSDQEEPVVPDLLVQLDLPSLCEQYEDYFLIVAAVPLSIMSNDNETALLNYHFNSRTA